MRTDRWDCWCLHPEAAHADGSCGTCARVWPKVMQPVHRYRPIETMPQIMEGIPHNFMETYTYEPGNRGG